MTKVPVFFHEAQLDFHPKYEWAFGNRIRHPESTRRAESIYRTVKKNKDLFEIHQPPRIPLSAIRECHSYQLVTLYNTASILEDNGEFYPAVYPQRMKAEPDPTNIHHAGFYCFDSGTPLNNRVWTAAAWSAASAYYAADWVRKGKSEVAYSLSRPPGHHASRDTYGGYCYFNNAAIAARHLRRKGPVALVDIDFHHGNGTQEMFYKDDKVLVISVHGDPAEYFPYFIGFPSEIGAGRGEGFNQNIVLKKGIGYREYAKAIRDIVLPAIRKFEPEYLVISAGFDTYEQDPIGGFKLMENDYLKLAKLFRGLKLKTVIIQEGGYHTKDLGNNVVNFLKGFT